MILLMIWSERQYGLPPGYGTPLSEDIPGTGYFGGNVAVPAPVSGVEELRAAGADFAGQQLDGERWGMDGPYGRWREKFPRAQLVEGFNPLI
jgi:hypothetical protein